MGEGERACAETCTFGGVTASCSDRIKFESTHGISTDPAPCGASREVVAEYCPICSKCELEFSGCKSSKAEAERACATNCTFKGMSSTCSDRIKWGSTHEMNGEVAPCAASRKMVLDYCPICGKCTLEASGCYLQTYEFTVGQLVMAMYFDNKWHPGRVKKGPINGKYQIAFETIPVIVFTSKVKPLPKNYHLASSKPKAATAAITGKSATLPNLLAWTEASRQFLVGVAFSCFAAAGLAILATRKLTKWRQGGCTGAAHLSTELQVEE